MGESQLIRCCQVPGCRGEPASPARAPVICQRHQTLDSRRGKFSVLLCWATLSVLAQSLHDRARRLVGEGRVEEAVGDPGELMTLGDIMGELLGPKHLLARVCALVMEPVPEPWSQSVRAEVEWALRVWPGSKPKPQRHLLATHLAMMEDFEHLRGPVYVQETKPTVVAVSRVGLPYVARWLKRVGAVKTKTGVEVLGVAEPWSVDPAKMIEEAKREGS